MKRIGYKFRRGILIFILILSLILTVGCGGDSGTPDQEQNGTQSGGLQQDQEDSSLGGDLDAIGLINFQTQDIYGNTVNQDIFKDYTLTLVNVWGTYCGPCLEEMPDLGELHEEYEPKGVNLVGIVIDVQDENMEIMEDQRELAKEITSGTGADYTHLLITEEMIDSVLNQFDAIPASFFVDSDGNIVSEFYIGSRSKKDWADIIETTLENL